MADRTEFSARIARIEARASGKLPPMPVIAPMVGEEWDIHEKPRRKLRYIFMPLALLAFCIGMFSDRLVAQLPQEILDQSEFLSSIADRDTEAFDTTRPASISGR